MDFKYIHTLDGKPATYQIFKNGKCKIFYSKKIKLVDSLKELKIHQKKAIENKQCENWDFGYVKIISPLDFYMSMRGK